MQAVAAAGASSSDPVLQETKTEHNARFHYGVAAMQGWRVSMVRASS